MKTIAIIPAAGIGKRISSAVPKQFVKIKNKELIAYTISVFQQNDNVNEIIVATRPEYFELLNKIKDRYGLTKLTGIVEGGAERQDSVYSALFYANANEDDLVAVHDAARPLLSQELLTKAIQQAEINNSIVTAIKAKDTLIKGNEKVESYLDRSRIYYAQTPQIFKYGILLEAMRKAEAENFKGTDESMLVKRYYGKVKIVEGESINFKITTDSDLKLFEKIIQSD